MSARLTGTAELRRALAGFSVRAHQELENIVNGTAQNIRTHAIKSVQRGTKSGVVYEKTNPTRTHRASATGEAPATDTGLLANSIKASIDGVNAEIVADTEYAAWLEFGTQNIQPRPFMNPALEKEKPKWEQRLSRLVDRSVRGTI